MELGVELELGNISRLILIAIDKKNITYLNIFLVMWGSLIVHLVQCKM